MFEYWGTQFNVSAYPEDDVTEIVLVEGAVSLFTGADGYDIEKNTMLEPGFTREVSIAKENSITTTAVITSIYTFLDGWRVDFPEYEF